MKLVLFLFASLIFISCKKDDQDTDIIYGYEYFPVNEGNYVVYDVIDIFHDVALNPAHDTDYYQIKEVIGESITDLEGETAQKLYRYYRINDTLDWAIKDVWTIKRTNRAAEVVEENDRIIKMAFAISYDQVWDGNALNNEDAVSFFYDDIYQPVSIGGIDYDSSVTVEGENFTSFIDYRRSYTIYGPRIGRIYSVNKNLSIDNFDTLDVQYGSELFYTAIEWGVE